MPRFHRPSGAARPRYVRKIVSSGIAALFAALTSLAALTAPPATALQVQLEVEVPLSQLIGGTLVNGVIDLSCGLISSLGVCVRLVTHAVVNGSPVVKEYNLLPILGPLLLNTQGQSVDVTGDGVSDLRVALAVPVTLLPPGYDANRPTLRITRLSTAPALLPVKVEVVTDDASAPGRKISFGYDARNSTAPAGFLAAVDQSNRDGLAQTSQVRIALSITPGANQALALTQERFIAGSSLSEAQRSDRSITQVGFKALPAGDAGPATRIPTSAVIDVTSSAGKQRFLVDSAPTTAAEFLMQSPEDNPKITGAVSHLPSAVDLTISDVDTNGDGAPDQSAFEYTGNAAVPQARFQFTALPKDSLGEHRRTIDISAEDLPEEVDLTYAPGPGTVKYAASDRAALVKVEGTDARPFFKRATGFTLTLNDLPKQLDAGYGGGNITALAYALDDHGEQVADHLGELQFSGRAGLRIVLPCIGTPDQCDEFGSLSASGFLQEDLPDYYLLYARIFNLRMASVVTEQPLPPGPMLPPVICGDPEGCSTAEPSYLDALVDTVADGDGSYRPFTARIRKLRDSDDPALGETSIGAKLSALVPMTHFVQLTGTEDGGLFTYSNQFDGAGPDVTVDAFNLDGLPSGKNKPNGEALQARELHIKLGGLPNEMEFTYGAGGFPLVYTSSGASDDKLDLLTVRMNSAAPFDVLPATEGGRPLDGVLIRDFNNQFVIDARVRNLLGANIDKKTRLTGQPCVGEDELSIGVQTRDDGTQPKLRFDSRKSDPNFSFPPPPEFTNALVFIEEALATVDTIPGSILLRKFPGGTCETRLEYDGDSVVTGGLLLHNKLTKQLYLNGFPVNGSEQGTLQDLAFTPLPRVLRICKSADKQICYGNAGGDASAGSLGLFASERTRFQVLDMPNWGVSDVTFTQVDLTFSNFQLVAHAPDSGESYIGIHTGWSGSGTPPLENTVSGSIFKQKEVVPDVEQDDFEFGEGFAANNRILAWDGTLDLVLAQASNSFFPMDRSGDVTCPHGLHIYERREAVADNYVTVDLGDDFCE